MTPSLSRLWGLRTETRRGPLSMSGGVRERAPWSRARRSAPPASSSAPSAPSARWGQAPESRRRAGCRCAADRESGTRPADPPSRPLPSSPRRLASSRRRGVAPRSPTNTSDLPRAPATPDEVPCQLGHRGRRQRPPPRPPGSLGLSRPRADPSNSREAAPNIDQPRDQVDVPYAAEPTSSPQRMLTSGAAVRRRCGTAARWLPPAHTPAPPSRPAAQRSSLSQRP